VYHVFAVELQHGRDAGRGQWHVGAKVDGAGFAHRAEVDGVDTVRLGRDDLVVSMAMVEE
jgi:hypothetical protein